MPTPPFVDSDLSSRPVTSGMFNPFNGRMMAATYNVDEVFRHQMSVEDQLHFLYRLFISGQYVDGEKVAEYLNKLYEFCRYLEKYVQELDDREAAHYKELTQKIADLDAKVDGYKNDIDSVVNNFNEFKTSIDNSLTEINAKLTEINKRITQMEIKLSAVTDPAVIPLTSYDKTGTTSEWIQNAVNDTASKKKILYIPYGDYNCDSTITIPDHCYIIGDGQSATKLIFPKGVPGLVDVKANGYSTDINIHDIGVVCSDEDWHSDSVAGISITSTSFVIDNVSVRWFATGFDILQVPASDYANLTHAGDVRCLSNINVYGCDCGVHNANQDMLMNNASIGSCSTYGINNASGLSATNIHIWAIKQYGIANSATINVTNLEIESDANRTANNSAFIRNWGGRACYTNVKMWNITNKVGNIIYNDAGVAIVSDLLIYKCSSDNIDKMLPPIALVNSTGDNKTCTVIRGALDNSYAGIVGGGYTNTGNANYLYIDLVSETNSLYTQPFVRKTGGTYWPTGSNG